MADTPEHGTDIKSYKLPVVDTQKQRRNFEGYEKKQYYNLGDLQQENNKYKENSGTTDTDAHTDEGSHKGYAAIYKKSGKAHGHGGKQLGLNQPHVPGTKTFGSR